MISIIVPAYNVEKYIDECLKSLLSQTYKDIEIIVVNDGSTDKTEDVIKKYLLEYSNIIYVYQENKGVSEARNLGLKKANGEFIYYIDPDDYIEKETLELMHKKMVETNSDIVICGHKSFYDDKDETEYKLYNVKEDEVYNNEYCIDLMLNYEMRGYVWDKLFKKKDLIENNFLFESGRYIQDWFPIFKQIYLAKRITFINKPLYNYRLRESSTVHKKNKKLLDDFCYAFDNINNFIINNNIKTKEKSILNFRVNAFYTVIRYYFLSYINEGDKKNKNVYKDFNNSIYKKYDVSIKDLILNGKILNKVTIKIIIWKMKIYHILYPIN